jgi:hypothetical protein
MTSNLSSSGDEDLVIAQKDFNKVQATHIKVLQ